MSGFSYPNDEDDMNTRLMYTVTAEFVYRLDEFLKEEQRYKSHYLLLPADTLRAVMDCAALALALLRDLQDAPVDPGYVDFCLSDIRKLCESGVPNLDAVHMVSAASTAIKAMQESYPHGSTCIVSNPLKARLMGTLGTEFFTRLHEMCASVELRKRAFVADFDVSMVQGCVHAALGMVSALNRAVWVEGEPVPAHVLEALSDQVECYQLECAGPCAVHLMEKIYEAVFAELGEQH